METILAEEADEENIQLPRLLGILDGLAIERGFASTQRL